MAQADIPWTPLKPGAQYNSTHGAFVAGVALLQMPAQPDGWITIVLCGAMSAGGRDEASARASAERHAESYRGSRRDLDFPMPRREFEALLAEPAA